MAFSSLRSEAPAQLAFVLALGGQSLRTEAAVQGTWPPVSSGLAAPVVNTQLSNPTAAAPQAEQSLGAWGLALAAAVLGGLILNLMPCVFPVLAIKVLGFAAQTGQSRAAQRAPSDQGPLPSPEALEAFQLSCKLEGIICECDDGRRDM